MLPLQFFVFLRGPSWKKGSCRSPRPSVSSEVKGVAVAVLRVPSWPFVEKRKLPPSVSSVVKGVAVAVAVLRVPSYASPTG